MTAPDLASTIFLPPTDTIRAWQERDALQPTVAWAEMMHEEHAVAFTVAKIARVDLLIKVRESLDSVIRDGGTFEQWKANILPELQKAGWWGVVQDKSLTGTDDAIVVNDRRLRNIYRTNIRMSIAAGRWRKYQREKDLFPYLRYLSDHYRKHPRLNHQSWHGIILPVDHPAWSWLFPPNGWGCNCRVVQVSERMMRTKGWTVSEPPNPGTFIFETADGREIDVPKGVQPGFGYNPGTAHLQALADRIAKVTRDAEARGLGTAANQLRRETADLYRDAMLTGAADEQAIAQGVAAAIDRVDTDEAIDFGRVAMRLRDRDILFDRELPWESIRKAQAKHGVAGYGRDLYPISSRDWQLIPQIMRDGEKWLDARDGTNSLIHVLRVADLDYVYVERIGLKRGNRLRGKSFYRAKRAQIIDTAVKL